MKGKIILHDLEFHAFHGVYPEEQKQGQTFVVNLEIDCDWGQAADSDQLADALDYVHVSEAVKEVMETRSDLLEHVAKRIIQRLKTDFPQIEEVNVTLTKRNPPIGIKTGGISVVLKG